jgi:hypothetical protein
MDERHARMWTAVANPEDVPDAIDSAPAWEADARRFAVL